MKSGFTVQASLMLSETSSSRGISTCMKQCVKSSSITIRLDSITIYNFLVDQMKQIKKYIIIDRNVHEIEKMSLFTA